jgi:UDP-3-O-[3-hydroxymyristoyl] glucosamine N-acyltransferase
MAGHSGLSCNPGWSYYWRKRVYKDHATLGSGAIVGAGSGVTCDVPAGKTIGLSCC